MTSRGVLSARGALLASTALLATVCARPASAQTVVPVLDNPGGATVTPTATGVDVNLNDANGIVRWKTFSLGSGATADFHTADTQTHLSVLNLVTTNAMSRIDGSITAQPNISVWLSNPAGIVFGGSGSFSGGALVLTTAAMTDFPGSGGRVTLSGATADTATYGADAGRIALEAGSRIGTAGAPVAGGVILAGQFIKVAGTIAANGTVALIAADTVTVPLDPISPIGITVAKGTTLGNATVDVSGRITAATIAVGGFGTASQTGPYSALLSIADGGALSATTVNGRVVLTANRASGEADASADPIVALAANAAVGGAGRIASAGTLAAGDRVWIGATGGIGLGNGSVTAGGGARALTVDATDAVAIGADLRASAGALSVTGSTLALSGSLAAAGALTATATTGDAVVSGNLAAGTGGALANLTVAATGGALTLGRTDGTLQTVRAGDDVSLTAGNGALSALGPVQLTSGTAAGVGSIYLSQAGAGGIALGAASLSAAPVAAATPGYAGDVFVVQSSGDVALGTVDAASFNLPQPASGGRSLAGTLFADRITVTGSAGTPDLSLVSTGGAIRVGEVRSTTGSVTIDAKTDVSGNIVPASSPVAYGVANVHAPAAGRSVSITAGGVASLGAVDAGQDITIDAPTIRGGTIPAIAQGLRVGTVNANGLLTITASGDARVGTVADAGVVAIGATGSVTGLLTGEAIDLAPAGATLRAGGSVLVGTNGTQPTSVALSGIDATRAVTVYGDAVQIGSIGATTAAATTVVTAGSALSVDHVGTSGTLAGAVSLRTDADTPADGTNLLVDAAGTLRAAYGFAALDTTLATATAADPVPLTVTAGNAVQLGQATAGTLGAPLIGVQVSITGNAIVAQGVAARNGTLALTANGGDLYLGSPATLAASFATTAGVPVVAGAAGNAMLTKTGSTAGTATRINGSLVAGTGNPATGTVTIRSDTDILGRTILGFGTIDLGATGTVGGLLAGETIAGDGLRIGRGASGGAIDVTATADARLGVLTSDTRLGVKAAGSVTGLATGDGGKTTVATLSLAADNSVTVHGLGNGTLAQATIGSVTAATSTHAVGPAVSIAANRIAAGSLGTGSGGPLASLALPAGAGLSVDGFATLGDARLGTTAGSIGGYALAVPDTLDASVPALAAGYGFASLVVTAAGGASDDAHASGLLTVMAGAVAQLARAQAGQASGLFTTAAGGTRDQVVVDAQAITLGVPSSFGGTLDTVGPYGAYAISGGLRLTAEQGGLYLGAGSAGTRATLTKIGATTGYGTDELRVGSLTGGTLAAATGALRGDVTLASATSVRATTLGSATGNIAVTAVAGDATGRLLATPAVADGRLLTDYGGTTLTAQGAAAGTAADPFRTITVVAPKGTIKVDSAIGGQGSAYTGSLASAVQIGLSGVAVDAAQAITRNGDLTITTDAGLLRLGTGTIARSATLTAGASGIEIGSLTVGADAPSTNGVASARAYDMAIVTTGAVTGLRGPAQAVASADAGLRLASVAAGTGQPDGTGLWGGTMQITGAGDVRLGGVTSTGALIATATGGSLTGLVAGDASPVAASGFVPGAVPGNTGYADLVAPHGSITIGGTSTGTPTIAAIGRALAATSPAGNATVDGGSVTITAAAITAGTVTAAQDVRLIAATGLSADAVTAALARDGVVVASTSIANGTGAAGAGYGAANLTANSLLARGITGTITASARQVAELGTLVAGASGGGAYTDTSGVLRDQITVGADTIWLGSALAYNGNLTLTAATGEITGLPFAATDPDATDGRLAVRRGRATLVGRLGNVTAIARGGTVQLGGVSAGRAIGVTAAAIDLGTALIAPVGDDYVAALGQRVTAGGGIALTTPGLVRVGIVTAGGDIAVGTAASITGASLASSGGNVTLTASGEVGGLLFPALDPLHATLPKAADGLRVGLGDGSGAADLTAGSVAIAAAGNARLGYLDAGGALSVTAAGSVTGLPMAAPVAIADHRYLDIAARGNVVVGSAANTPRLGVADLKTVTAGGSIGVTADRIVLGTGTAGTSVTLTAGAGLSADHIVAGTTAMLSTDTAGGGENPKARLFDPTIVDGVTTGTLAPDFGSAVLRAGGALSVMAGTNVAAANATGVAQLGTIIGSDVAVTGQAIAIRSTRTDLAASAATVRGAGNLSLHVLTGALYLDSGSVATGTATLTKDGVDASRTDRNELRVGTLTAAGTILARSDTSIRGTSLTSIAGDILLRADLETTGLSAVTATSGELRIGNTAAARDVTDKASGDIRLGTVAADGAIGIASTIGSVTGLPSTPLTGRSTLQLAAFQGGVDVRGRTTRLDVAAIDAVTAARTPTLESPAPSFTVAPLAAVRVDANTIGIRSIQAATGVASDADVVLTAAKTLEVGEIGTGRRFRDVTATSSGGTSSAIALSTTGSTLADGIDPHERLDAGYGSAQLEAGTTVAVTAAKAAQLGTLAGSAPAGRAAITVGAQGIAIQVTDPSQTQAVLARTGDVALTASNGGLYLESAKATTGAIALLKSGTADIIDRANEVRVGSAEAATTLAIASATGIRARALTAHGAGTATTPAIALTAGAGSITGLLTTTPDGDATQSPWGRAALTADAAGARIVATAANAPGLASTVQLGTVTAGSGTAATRTLDQIVVTAGQIDIATLRDRTTGTRRQSLTAANGNLVLVATAGNLRLGQASVGGGVEDYQGPTSVLDGLRATGAGNVEIGSVTAGLGDVRVFAANGDVSGLTSIIAPVTATDSRLLPTYGRADLAATAANRQVTVSASGTAQLGTVTAGSGTGLMTATDPAQVRVGSAAIDAAAVTTLNGDLRLTTATGLLRLGTGTIARAATLAAGTAATADAQIGRLVTGAYLPADTVATPGVYSIAITASGAVGGLRTTGQPTAFAADGLRLGTAIAGQADGAGSVSGGVQITGAGDVRLGSVTSTGAALTATSTGGSLTGLIATDASPVAASGFIAGASPTSTGYADLVAAHGSIDVRASSAAIGRASAVSRTGTGVAVDGGSVTVTAGTITAGVVEAGQTVTLAAASGLSADTAAAALVRAGSLIASTTIANGTGATVSAAGATYGAADLTARSLASRGVGTIAVAARQVAQLGTVTAGAAGGPAYVDAGNTVLDQITVDAGTIWLGSATANNGNVALLARTGDITGLPFAARDADATDGRLAPRRGRAAVTSAIANGRIVATASAGTVQLGTVAAGAGTGSGTGNQVQVAAAAIDIARATASNAALSLTATTGSLVLGTGDVAGSATLTKTGNIGSLAVNGTLTAASILASSDTNVVANTLGSAGDLTLNAFTDVDLSGTVTASRTLRINNTGLGAEYLGGPGTGSSPFALTAAELNRLVAPTIIVDARANPLTIGSVTFGSNGSNAQFDLLSTGAITLTGAVALTGPSIVGNVMRTLQIGGTSDVPVTANTLPSALATSVTGTLDSGASLAWGGTIDLRAAKVTFGNGSLIGTANGLSDAQIATDLVSRPTSVLYTGTGSQAYLAAGKLVVRYADYALFQNTGGNSATTAGSVLGTSGGTGLALDLYSAGNNAANSFALFGTINGQGGRSAVLLPEAQLGYATGGTTNITLVNSRVNGCVIAAPGAGCLTVVQLPPALRLFDERQIQLFDTAQNEGLTFEPLIGTGNDALLGDIPTPALLDTAACPPGSAPTDCPSLPHKEPQP